MTIHNLKAILKSCANRYINTISNGKTKCCQLTLYLPSVIIGIAITLVNTLIGPTNINNIYKAINEYHFPVGK